MAYKTKIGMEIHIQPTTKSKLFCNCPNEFAVAEPNKNICEICTGQPGALPVINRKAIEAIVKAGLALGSEINRRVHWDRKHYFYPDLPRGFQITQNETPLCKGGSLLVEYIDEKGEPKEKKVLINRLHLEEDAGKDLHPTGADYSLVDFNRAGAPLIELVTEPVLENKEQAVAFCKALQQIFRYAGVSEADMEKGQMRCEVNISLGKDGKDGTKVEVKNINSFKGVARSVEFEEKRQQKLLDEGEKVVQETRGWNADKQATVSQRTKEEAHDYRYFPEPDLPWVNITDEELASWKNSLGEMPKERETRFVKEAGISRDIAALLVSDIEAANYFDKVISELGNWLKDAPKGGDGEKYQKLCKLASNYLTTELVPLAFKDGKKLSKIKIEPEHFAELIGMIFEGQVNSSAAQAILYEMYASGGDPSQIAEDKNLLLEQDEGVVKAAVKEVLKANEKAIADWKNGRDQALQFLVGQVMAKTKGRAEPKAVREMIEKSTK